jgi:tetratricopeptide (TPR) repeat protein
VTADQLDKGVMLELRTLPEGLADLVAKHLVAADNALVEGDIDLARRHIAAAKRRAGRVAAVREAAGIAAYLAGDFAAAIPELRAVRRMSGGDQYVPMLADCERALGRPKRALDMIKEVDQRALDQATRVELMLVSAGARADLGQVGAALILLNQPELTKLPAGTARARLQYAYAELLLQDGQDEQALVWMRRAAESDVEGATDAAERVEESEGGLQFEEEEFSDDASPASESAVDPGGAVHD